MRSNWRLVFMSTFGLVLLATPFDSSYLLAAVSSTSLQSTKTGAKDSSYSAVKQVLKDQLELRQKQSASKVTSTLFFDFPVTYNNQVRHWLTFFQTRRRDWFKQWLEKSHRYTPLIQAELKEAGLPLDLVYIVMIESGFNSNAVSPAGAVGPWQFMEATGVRYGLRVSPWLDERRDIHKSTLAAIRYLRDLHQEFKSWYLVAASYNMGENGLRRKIKKHSTYDFWELSRLGALPKETIDYVPKIIAAMMIAKAPSLYGFEQIRPAPELDYDLVTVPGGTDLDALADHLNVTRKSLRDLNKEMILGYLPNYVRNHRIRIPKGALPLMADFLNPALRPKTTSTM